ncbi:replication protein A 32 kDa subunit [Bacillus rossius redtenbacheri]|uniref:replication protein A 32 kDa subunit n=1 Tax=Bacillus rossius redtenbacheri TaxID=93214 RepID=UPI002FDDD05C
MFGGKGFDSSMSGGGGFMNTTAQFGTPDGQQDKKGPKRMQNIVPVTIRQLLESSDDDHLRLASKYVHMVTLVGVVRSVSSDSMKVTYMLDDDTGTISVHNWIDTDGGTQDSSPRVEENCYYRVFGTLRTQSGQRHVTLFKILPITDLNELTTHLLEVINCSLQAEQMERNAPAMEVDSAEGDVHMANSLMHSNMGDDMATGGSIDGLTSKQRAVYSVIKKNSHNDCGVECNQIMRDSPVKMSTIELKNILSFLITEGHIYSTIDDDHYKATDT